MMRVGGVLGALVVFAATVALAEPPPASRAPGQGPANLHYDSNKPIQVNADTFSADMNAETGTYRGNVVVVQGDIKLRADEVRVIAPNGKAQRMEAHGNVVVDSPSGSATGDQGIYEVAARVIHLTGNVKLTKGQNVMRGSALDVQMATGQARLVAVGANGQPARVQGLFIPQTLNAPNKPAPVQKPPAAAAPGAAPAVPAAAPNP